MSRNEQRILATEKYSDRDMRKHEQNRGEVISSPRVITANQKEAKIEQGVEIPYQEASSSGATTVSFQDAVLSLRVTPQITPDDRIIIFATRHAIPGVEKILSVKLEYI